jgi:CheY-like chemotaxis protein
VTERDEGFLEAERRRALARLVPPLVHRLNNSLAIVGGTKEMRLEGEADLSRNELARMRGILRHLSLLAKSHTPDRSELDLAQLVAAVELLLVPFAESVHVELDVVDASGRACGTVDPYRLEQLVLVLLFRLIVAAAPTADSARPAPRVRFGVRASGERVVLLMAGPRAEDAFGAACLAEVAAFARETGLGAFLRELGKASAFRLVLPRIASPESERDEVVVPEPRRSEPAPPLLLVERDPRLRELIVSVLAEAGYVVETLEEPAELDELPRTDSGLVLLDAEVEHERPGLVTALRERGRCSVLVLGQTLPFTPQVTGDYLPKPFRPQELLDAVRERLTPEPSA